MSISLHCYEANALDLSVEEYLAQCFAFCAEAAERGIIAVMRLWNIGGEDALNGAILAAMHEAFPGEWKAIYSGYKLAERVFLEWGERFDWPDVEGDGRWRDARLLWIARSGGGVVRRHGGAVLFGCGRCGGAGEYF